MRKTQFNPIRILREIIIAAMIFGVVYFGNQAVQSWLGERAIENSGMEHLTFDSALIASSAQGKPLLTVFGALWCPACRKLDNNVFSNPEVQATIRSNFAFSRLDYDSKDKKWFQEYGVTRFPTIILFDGSGMEITRVDHSYDPQAFNDRLNALSTQLAKRK